MTYRVVIVGLGRIGMGYDLDGAAAAHVLSHARAFASHPRFQLLAGVDGERSHREAFQTAYGRPAYDDIESAMAVESPDVVVIAVPTIGHAAAAARVLACARPAAILCEKPVAYDLVEARTIADRCEANGVKLFVNYIRRSDPAAIEVHRRILQREISAPMKGVAWYSKGFLHNGSHLFNLLQFWLGPMIDASLMHPGRSWNTVDSEPDVLVRFERGTMVFLAAREEQFSHCALELLAQNGRLRYDRGGEIVEWTAREFATAGASAELAQESERLPAGLDRYQWHVTNQLGFALDGAPAEICSGGEAIATLECMHTIIRMRKVA